MAWIELHQTLPTHRKIKKLKRLLKIKMTPQAVGHIVMLWLWSIDNAPDGDLSQIDAEDIAEAAEWPKSAEEFVAAMQEAGWIDADMRLHDWGEYGGKLQVQREVRRKKERDRKARYREKKREEERNAADSSEDVPRDNTGLSHGTEADENETETDSHAPTLHNTTLHNTTEYYKDLYSPRPPRACAGAVPSLEPEEQPGEANPQLSDAIQAVQMVVTGETSPQANPEFGRVMSFYLNRVNATPSHTSIEELGTFAETMDADVIIKAMEYALDEHKATWSYIRGTLRAYQGKGIRTMTDLQRANDEFEKAKKRREETHNASTRRNSQGRGTGGTPPADADPLRGFHTEP